MTTLEKNGSRIYFRDAPFAAKDRIKALGAHWDADARSWWIGAVKEALARQLVLDIDATAQQAEATLPPASGSMVEVPGNTYPAREQLRAMGGAWDADAKVWRVPASRLDAAKAAVANAPAAKPFRHTQCKQCGARPNNRGYPRIYRNGVCSDCYRDMHDEDY